MYTFEREYNIRPKFTSATQPIVDFLVTKAITLPEVARRLSNIKNFRKTKGYTLEAVELEREAAKPKEPKKE
jgi:hypothetical protein